MAIALASLHHGVLAGVVFSIAGLMAYDLVELLSFSHGEPRAMYRVPTVNLDTASAETSRGARAKWGAVLNAAASNPGRYPW